MSPLPEQGRLAGIDYGTVRIGVAVCDPDRILASPLEIYQRAANLEQDSAYFKKLAEEEKLVGWVVGLPVHLSGDESEKSREAKMFGKWLAELSQLPVAFVDERMTSSEATQLLAPNKRGKGGRKKQKRNKHVDAVAAQLILNAYLEGSWHDGQEQPLDDHD
jgi:putative Holliday junction resolvase